MARKRRRRGEEQRTVEEFNRRLKSSPYAYLQDERLSGGDLGAYLGAEWVNLRSAGDNEKIFADIQLSADVCKLGVIVVVRDPALYVQCKAGRFASIDCQITKRRVLLQDERLIYDAVAICQYCFPGWKAGMAALLADIRQAYREAATRKARARQAVHQAAVAGAAVPVEDRIIEMLKAREQ